MNPEPGPEVDSPPPETLIRDLSPPLRVLVSFLALVFGDHVSGDLAEQLKVNREQRGDLRALARFWWEVFGLLPLVFSRKAVESLLAIAFRLLLAGFLLLQAAAIVMGVIRCFQGDFGGGFGVALMPPMLVLAVLVAFVLIVLAGHAVVMFCPPILAGMAAHWLIPGWFWVGFFLALVPWVCYLWKKWPVRECGHGAPSSRD